MLIIMPFFKAKRINSLGEKSLIFHTNLISARFFGHIEFVAAAQTPTPGVIDFSYGRFFS